MSYPSPRSPKDEIDGLPVFRRLCDKVRLHAADRLHPQYHGNLGKGMDLWTCQFLGIDYAELAKAILNGPLDDEAALAWARGHGVSRPAHEAAWWRSYITHRGFRDDLSAKLAERKAESGFEDRDDIMTFMDYIDADEGRM